MAKQTKAEKLVEYLTQIRGYKEVLCRSCKYREFVHPDMRNHRFIGKAGAYRIGATTRKSSPLLVDWKRLDLILKTHRGTSLKES